MQKPRGQVLEPLGPRCAPVAELRKYDRLHAAGGYIPWHDPGRTARQLERFARLMLPIASSSNLAHSADQVHRNYGYE